MIFHSGFRERALDFYDTPSWFESRSQVYKEVASWNNKNIDQVYFDFSAPDCGWMYVSIYVNGKKIHEFPLTAAFDPFHELKTWMEDIVNDFKLSSDLYLELEGRTAILHYEHIKLAQVGSERKFVHEEYNIDEWEDYDANYGAPDICLFYLYDSGVNGIPVVCCCRTKDFLLALYNGLLYYASRTKNAPLIGKEWYYMDHDDDGNPIESNWTFYNRLKSPLIEWNLDSRLAYRHERPVFKDHPMIKETVHMWTEWGDGLFWHQRGGCCGNAEEFFVDTESATIDLSDLPDIRTWYDEFDMRTPDADWPDEQFKPWLNKGWELAKIVRTRLPMEVDLFYHWKPFKLDDNEWGYVDIPIIVPDTRLLIPKEERYEKRKDLP